jgi:shikimate kinase
MQDSDIIIIGPIGVGKSTIGGLLSQALEMDLIELDDVWLGYATEIGYDAEFAKLLHSRGGFWASYMYRKEFCCYAVERVLEDHDNCVFAFGAGHSVYETPPHLARIQGALEPCPSVILLLPSPEAREAQMKVLAVRPDVPDEIKEHLLMHHSNRTLCDPHRLHWSNIT